LDGALGGGGEVGAAGFDEGSLVVVEGLRSLEVSEPLEDASDPEEEPSPSEDLAARPFLLSVL